MKPIAILLMCCLWQSVVYSQHQGEAADPAARKAWVKATVKILKTEANRAAFSIAEPRIIDLPDLQLVSYRVQGDIRIACTDGGWVYIRPHSSHENARIGDVSVAVDSRGRAYVHFGHICGGSIRFSSERVHPPATPEDFFLHFLDDEEDKPWARWKR